MMGLQAGLILILAVVACSHAMPDPLGTGLESAAQAAETSVVDQNVAEAIVILHDALAKVSAKCNETIWNCVRLHSDAAQALQDKKYCSMISDPRAYDCLVTLTSGCTDVEYNDLKTTLCPSKEVVTVQAPKPTTQSNAN